MPASFVIYASNEPKSVLARDLGDCRDNLRNSRSVFLVVIQERGEQQAVSNIVVLSGSVRKGGNTELLVQAFVDGAKKNNNVEVISVADYKVNPCIGCNTCFDREGHECFQKDDMTKVYEKLKMADVLVIASPVYFYGVSAQLKALIDRLHTPMRNEFTLLPEGEGGR